MRKALPYAAGIAVVPLIFGVMVLGILGVAISWEIYNTQVSSVDAVEMQQAYTLVHSGIEFAIGYANDPSNAQRHRALKSPGQRRILPASGAFPGGEFTVVWNPASDVLTSTSALSGSTAHRELRLRNFVYNYVEPDLWEKFDELPDLSFDQRYFVGTGGWGGGTDVAQTKTVVLSSIDDPFHTSMEQKFTMPGENNPDPGARAGFFHMGGDPWESFGETQEYIMIIPTTPGTGRLQLRDSFDDSGPLLERTGLPLGLDEQGYQNYSIEVKFALSFAFPQEYQGFGIIFRLHHPRKPLAGPWNKTDLDYTLAYVLQMEPAIGRWPRGSFLVRWWAADPSRGGRGSENGSCGGAPLYFDEEYCEEQEATAAGFVDVYKGGFFSPENPPQSPEHSCSPSAPNNPGWGWRDVSWLDNSWFNCDYPAGNRVPDMHTLRVDVYKNTFTVYFGTEHGITCDDTDSFVMHKIMEINVAEERSRRGVCVPDYKTGHLGLRVWNGFQARVDSIKVWQW